MGRRTEDGGQRAARISFVSSDKNVSISVSRISLILLNMAVDIPERPQDVEAAREWMLQYRDRMKLLHTWPAVSAIPQSSDDSYITC